MERYRYLTWVGRVCIPIEGRVSLATGEVGQPCEVQWEGLGKFTEFHGKWHKRGCVLYIKFDCNGPGRLLRWHVLDRLVGDGNHDYYEGIDGLGRRIRMIPIDKIGFAFLKVPGGAYRN